MQAVVSDHNNGKHDKFFNIFFSSSLIEVEKKHHKIGVSQGRELRNPANSFVLSK